jgi:hypothetical protein
MAISGEGNSGGKLCSAATLLKASKQIFPHAAASAAVARRIWSDCGFRLDSGATAMRYLLLNSWLEQRSRLHRRTDGHPRCVSIVSESQQGNSTRIGEISPRERADCNY